MNLKRLFYTIRLYTIGGGRKRANYIKNKNVYASVGEKCSIQKRKIPLYPNLIRLGNNVHLASGVSFITHDIAHLMLNNIDGLSGVQERIGCIEIGDNVFVGAGVRILYDTKIGSNVIIGAGSTVTKDIPSNSVAVGSPARVISSLDDYLKKALSMEQLPKDMLPKHQTVNAEAAKLLWSEFDKKHASL